MTHETRVRALLGWCVFLLVLIVVGLATIGAQLNTLTEVLR